MASFVCLLVASLLLGKMRMARPPSNNPKAVRPVEAQVHNSHVVTSFTFYHCKSHGQPKFKG